MVNRVRQFWPRARVTLYTGHSRALVASRIKGDFTHLQRSPDPGMAMHHALDVDADASYLAYRELFRDWPATLDQECERLRGVDLVIADIPFATLAAARRLGIPGVAVCSLNWADIFERYCGDRADARAWIEEMAAAYRQADLFLQPAPSMPMGWLDNRLAIGPLVAMGRTRREALRVELGVGADARILLASLGGIPTRMAFEHWPRGAGIHYLIRAGDEPPPGGFSDLGALGWPFPDVMASVDGLLTKPGYGMFSEAACLGLPVLFVRRNDWPEEPHLVEWLLAHGRAREIARENLDSGRFIEDWRVLLEMPATTPPLASGAEEGAAAIRDLFAKGIIG